MNKDKRYNFALILKTDGLEYDDRVRKEILSIQKLYPNISFKIFVLLPDNKESEGVTSYGIPYKSIKLQSRDKYASKEKLMLKSIEFYKVVSKDIKHFDAIWCAELATVVVAALAPKKHLIWDLHELPTALLGNCCTRTLLKYIFKRCKVVVHANPQRTDYLKSLGLIRDAGKHYAIRNYPNFDDVDTVFDEKYQQFIAWKGNRRCVYLQGLSVQGRAAYESIKAVLSHSDLVAVVIGDIYSPDKGKLMAEYGDKLEERVFFAGRINQLKIPQYVAQCISTLVFYQNIRANNYYCEANRFYQSVIIGLPVVVGNNPPMRDIVNEYQFGVSVDDDGRDVEMMSSGLDQILSNYDYYKSNVLKNRDALTWDKQEDVLSTIVEKLLS